MRDCWLCHAAICTASFSSLHLFNPFVAVTDTNGCHVLRRLLLGDWEESHWIYFQVSMCAVSCAAKCVVCWILCKFLSAFAGYLTMALFRAKTNCSLNLTFSPAVTEPPAPSQSCQACFVLCWFLDSRWNRHHVSSRWDFSGVPSLGSLTSPLEGRPFLFFGAVSPQAACLLSN